MKIGFIGLGNMGSGMAANLLKAGHQVIAYNRSQAKVDALAARGAVAARSVAEASSADIVFTMLANDDAVEAAAVALRGFPAIQVLGPTDGRALVVAPSADALADALEVGHAAGRTIGRIRTAVDPPRV